MRKLFILALITLTATVSLQSQNLQEKNTFGPRPDLKGDLTLSFGLNMLQGNDVDDMNVRTFGNNSFNVGYMYPINISNSNFSFNAGVNFSFNKFAFDGDSTTLEVVSAADELGNVRLQTIGEDLVGENGFVEKSKFESSYVNIPLEFRYYFNKDKVNNGGLFLAAGGSIGYLINGKTKIKYVENEQTKKIKRKESFELNQFRYGAHFRIGIAGFGAHFEYDFSELFNPGRGPLNGDSVDPQPTQMTPFRFGLSFNLF